MRFIPQFEPYIKPEYANRVAEQIKSGWVGPSGKTEEFEKRIGEMYERNAVSATSGTAAIILALSSLNLPKGAVVYFPAYTFLAGANAAKFLGFDVKLVDVAPYSLSMDPEELEKQIAEDNPKDACVMFVDHNGYCGEDLKKVRFVCDKYNFPLIEDSAQCFGIENAAKTGDISIFSFSVPKIITTGQGGMALTKNETYFAEMKKYRDHGDNWRKTRVHEFLGINLKFNDILAEFGLAQIDNFKEIFNQKLRITNEYKRRLAIFTFGLPIPWMIIHRSKNSEKIIERLRDNNIQAVKYYRPLFENNIYKTDQKFPCAEVLGEELVYLPSSLNLTDEEIEFICDIVNKTDYELGRI